MARTVDGWTMRLEWMMGDEMGWDERMKTS